MPTDQFFTTRWNNGTLIRPQVALNALRQNPEHFLKQHPIQNTFDIAASGQTNLYILNDLHGGQRPGTVMRNLHMHTTEAFIIQRQQGQLEEGYLFSAHGIHMVAANQQNNYNAWYTLDGSGADIMLTAKLTGCTFVAKTGATPGSLQVTHIRPNDQMDGLALNRQQDVPGQAAWGRLKYDLDSRAVNVIGVRHGGQWQIYAQKIDKHALVIRSVKRII